MARSMGPAWLALALTGCPAAPPIDGVEAGVHDAGAPAVDGRVEDGPAVDAALDAMPDAMPDAMRDAMPDAMRDAIPDAAPPAVDATRDATLDAIADAIPDMTGDGLVDAAPGDDAVVDAARDRSVPIWDAAVDLAVDAAVDAGSDAVADAEPDMAPFDGPARSDDFEQAPLGGFWSVFNPHLFEREVRDGSLWLTPRGFGLWFDRSTGPLVYQRVTGDFRVTARVRARRASDPAAPPADAVHLGGLMVRDPMVPPENYVFIVVGRDIDDLSVETKSTVDGRSEFVGPMWPDGGDAELRICRIGADFHMYKRPVDGGEWQLAISYVRDGLPPTVQVGPIAYTNSVQPDLTVGFDEIAFAAVDVEADCVAD